MSEENQTTGSLAGLDHVSALMQRAREYGDEQKFDLIWSETCARHLLGEAKRLAGDDDLILLTATNLLSQACWYLAQEHVQATRNLYTWIDDDNGRAPYSSLVEEIKKSATEEATRLSFPKQILARASILATAELKQQLIREREIQQQKDEEIRELRSKLEKSKLVPAQKTQQQTCDENIQQQQSKHCHSRQQCFPQEQKGNRLGLGELDNVSSRPILSLVGAVGSLQGNGSGNHTFQPGAVKIVGLQKDDVKEIMVEAFNARANLNSPHEGDLAINQLLMDLLGRMDTIGKDVQDIKDAIVKNQSVVASQAS